MGLVAPATRLVWRIARQPVHPPRWQSAFQGRFRPAAEHGRGRHPPQGPGAPGGHESGPARRQSQSPAKGPPTHGDPIWMFKSGGTTFQSGSSGSGRRSHRSSAACSGGSPRRTSVAPGSSSGSPDPPLQKRAGREFCPSSSGVAIWMAQEVDVTKPGIIDQGKASTNMSLASLRISAWLRICRTPTDPAYLVQYL